jgi:hypothetical protein
MSPTVQTSWDDFGNHGNSERKMDVIPLRSAGRGTLASFPPITKTTTTSSHPNMLPTVISMVLVTPALVVLALLKCNR